MLRSKTLEIWDRWDVNYSPHKYKPLMLIAALYALLCRGEALMHAQQATREAQREQAQLSEMLKQTLQQLGMAITPNRSPAGTPDGEWGGSGGDLELKGVV